ncbi:MAG: protein kinase [bacterium]
MVEDSVVLRGAVPYSDLIGRDGTLAANLLERIAVAVRADYRVARELGAGATATVYLAHDLKHDRLVALKVLRPELALAVGAERFLREIRTAANLSHPGILPLYHSGEADGLLFFAMPLVRGESLRDRLVRERTMPVQDAVRLITEVAHALAHAHEHGVVHRDIKPENILMEGDRPLIADFGIALAMEGQGTDIRLTHTGMVVGTPHYMSPEQASGGAGVDHRSDIYSLGCTLFEMLAGRPPFVGETPKSIVAQQVLAIPPSVREWCADVPAAVESTIEQSLAKNPADRFDNANAFAAALIDPGRRVRSRRMLSRTKRRLAAWTAGSVVVAVAGAVVAHRLAAPAPLRARDWVLVADFDGPRTDPTLAGAIRELVTTELNQSRYLTTMPRQQLASALRAAGLPDTTTVNSDLGRELAFRTAVRAVITGRIDTTQTGYALTMRAVDAGDGRELASVTAATTTERVVPTVQQLARDVRQRLGEQRGDLEANQLLLDIATPSFPAYRKYVNALARKPLGDVAGSTRLLHEAIALDTGFASAWAVMGMNYVEARNLDSARAMFQEALRRPSRLSTAQRYRLLGDAAYTVDRDLPGAVRWYDEYLKEVPRSIGGRNNRGLYLSMLGRYDDALVDFEQSADNSPFGPDLAQAAILNATEMLVALGRLDRAKAKARDLTGTYAQLAAIRLLTVSNQWAAAESLTTKTLATGSLPPGLRIEANTTRASSLAALGSAVNADRMLETAAAAGTGAERRWYEEARSLLAITSGQRHLDMGTLTAADSAPGAFVARGIRYALTGDTVRARAAAQHLAALSAGEQARLGLGPVVINALVDGSTGRWRQVAVNLSAPARLGEHDASNLDRIPSLTLRWLVADAYAHLGQLDSAATFMSLAIGSERVPPGHQSLRGLAYPYGTALLTRWRNQQRAK